MSDSGKKSTACTENSVMFAVCRGFTAETK